MKLFFAAEFTKNNGQTTLEGEEGGSDDKTCHVCNVYIFMLAWRALYAEIRQRERHSKNSVISLIGQNRHNADHTQWAISKVYNSSIVEKASCMQCSHLYV